MNHPRYVRQEMSHVVCGWADSALCERVHLAQGRQEVNVNIHGGGLEQQSFCPRDEGRAQF
jgi:hypothetical protein